jgi:hypothetical protein
MRDSVSTPPTERYRKSGDCGTVNLSFSLPVWTSRSGRKRPYAGLFCPRDHAFCREFRSS